MFSRFRRYLPEFTAICVQDESCSDPTNFFMSSASFNTCKERIKKVAADRNVEIVADIWEKHEMISSLGQVQDLLNPSVSEAVIDMSRLEPTNRMKNEHFGIMIRRKLRLPSWPGIASPMCFCGKVMDEYGDHCLSCTCHCKTSMSNGFRNGLAELLK